MICVDAVVLAGSFNDGRLREMSGENYEAMVAIGDKPMVAYVVETLRNSPQVKRIAIAGPEPEMFRLFGSMEGVVFAPAGVTAVESCLNALDVLQPDGPVLVATSDIPLLTTGSVVDFIQSCTGLEADLFYPVVAKEVNEKYYPGVERTYARLKEGTFTGGNLFLLNPLVMKACAAKAEMIVQRRKSPLALARMVGWMILLKLVFHQLTLQEAAASFSSIFGIKGIAIISTFPEVGIDVDKPSDLLLVRRELAKKARS